MLNTIKTVRSHIVNFSFVWTHNNEKIRCPWILNLNLCFFRNKIYKKYRILSQMCTESVRRKPLLFKITCNLIRKIFKKLPCNTKLTSTNIHTLKLKKKVFKKIIIQSRPENQLFFKFYFYDVIRKKTMTRSHMFNQWRHKSISIPWKLGHLEELPHYCYANSKYQFRTDREWIKTLNLTATIPKSTVIAQSSISVRNSDDDSLIDTQSLIVKLHWNKRKISTFCRFWNIEMNTKFSR